MGANRKPDVLLEQAIAISRVNKDNFSISLLQRRLRLGYIMTAQIVDQMEQRGYVGPFKDGKREVFI